MGIDVEKLKKSRYLTDISVYILIFRQEVWGINQLSCQNDVSALVIIDESKTTWPTSTYYETSWGVWGV